MSTTVYCTRDFFWHLFLFLAAKNCVDISLLLIVFKLTATTQPAVYKLASKADRGADSVRQQQHLFPEGFCKPQMRSLHDCKRTMSEKP